tara:strand:+ start:4274 stop:4873 length:600 start_codon:yes stop_codon:yes gene_type:complete
MKQFSKQKIQRMRNLATGDYGSKTKASSGYTSYEKKRSEGDVWEENDKTWTIKNGIKQNKTKLGDARKNMQIPLACPSCSGRMNNSAHKKMYRLFSHCLNCQNKYEHNMVSKGVYREWFEKEVRKNFSSWTLTQEQNFNIWFESLDSSNLITESGQIEDWSKLSSDDKKNIKQRFKDWIDSEKELTEKLLKGEQHEHID